MKNRCKVDTFMPAESFVRRVNICGKNPAHRKSASSYLLRPDATVNNNIYKFGNGSRQLLCDLVNLNIAAKGNQRKGKFT
jgi:hypothetical protein